MSKVLATAAMVVGAVALIAATGGAAAFGIGIAAAASTVTVAGLSIGTLLAISSVLSVAAALTAKRPRTSIGGSQTAFKADPNAGLPYAIGYTLTGGNIVYRRAGGGSDNPYQTLVTILSGAGPIESFEGFTLDKQPTSFSGSGSALGRLAGLAWQRTQLGASPEAAALTTAAPTTPPGWGADQKLSGLAASILTFKFDGKSKNVTLTSTPGPGWLVKGVKVYDPRLDSTYPGGSGACRALNESTYVWSENPYLHALTWLLGRYQNGKRILGAGLPTWAIDIAAYVEGANIADANGWTLGGVVSSSDSKWNVLKAMLQAGGGEPLHLGAKISCLVNTPRVSLGTISADDIVGEVSVTATQSRRDRFNTVIARYRSEPHQWEVVPTAPITVAAHVTEDGGQRTKEIEYALVQDLDQVAQLARYDEENAREFGPIVTPCPVRYIGFKPGDCLDVTVPEVGLNGQRVLVLNRSIDPASGTVTLTSRSETAAKHAIALGQTTTAPATPGVSGPPLAPAPAPGSWAISATSISGSGITQPVLQITGAIDSTIADGIVFEYRVAFVGQADDAGWIGAGIELPATTVKVIGPINPATSYEVAVSYRARGTVGNRLILGPVTSGALSGAAGPPGSSNAVVYAYQRSASGAPALPSATASYDFGTKALTGLNNGWSATIPAGTNPLYVTAATASSTTSTDTIAAGEWAAAQLLAQSGANGTNGSNGSNGSNGVDGINSATIFLFQRNNTGTAPSAPSVTTTYTFSSGNLAGVNNGWSQLAPDPSGGAYLFMTTATALAAASSTTDTIAAGEWAAVKRIVQDGANGAPGSNGAPGTNGTNGTNGFTISPASKSFVIQSTNAGTPKAGEFNKVVTFKVLQGTTDISDDGATTYALANTNINATMGGTNGKVFTATGMTADSGRSTVTVSRSGVAIGVIDLDFDKAKDGAAASTGLDDTLSAMPNSTTLGLLGSFDIYVGNGATLAMDANVAWFASSGSYPGRIAISYQNLTDAGAEVFSSEAAGDLTATTSEQAVASITGFAVVNSAGATKLFRVKVYGRRASGAGASSGTTGYVNGSAS